MELDEGLRSTGPIPSFSDEKSGPEKLYNFAKVAEGWVADPDEETKSSDSQFTILSIIPICHYG